MRAIKNNRNACNSNIERRLKNILNQDQWIKSNVGKQQRYRAKDHIFLYDIQFCYI